MCNLITSTGTPGIAFFSRSKNFTYNAKMFHVPEKLALALVEGMRLLNKLNYCLNVKLGHLT